MEILSWFIVAFGLVGFWITGRHNWGWLIGVTFQVMWTAYALHLGLKALAVQSVVFGFISARNYVVGRKRCQEVEA